MATTRRAYIFLTFLTTLIAAGLTFASLATEQWVQANGKFDNDGLGNLPPTRIKYGLFKGIYNLELGDLRPYEIVMTCLYKHNVCALLCGDTSEQRVEVLEKLYAQEELGDLTANCHTVKRTFASPSVRLPSSRLQRSGKTSFLNAGCILSTIIFLSLSSAFGTFSAFLSLWNTAGNPIQNYFGVKSLYLYNAIAGTCALIAIVIWGSQFASIIIHNVWTMHTIDGQLKEDSTHLGFSYWLNLGSLFLYVTSIMLLFIRDYLIEQEPEIRVDIDNDNNENIMLY